MTFSAIHHVRDTTPGFISHVHRSSHMKRTPRLQFGLFFSLATLLPLTTSAKQAQLSSQTQSSHPSRCKAKDPHKPALFISYEKSDQVDRNEKNAPTHLRLHNNSSCRIVVETEDLKATLPSGRRDLYKQETFVLPNGGVGTRYIPDPPEGALLPIYYDIQETLQQKAKPANDRKGGDDQVFVYAIPAGRSVVFAVRTELILKRYRISIRYGYEWEDRDFWKDSEVAHRVYYDPEKTEGGQPRKY